MATIKIKRTTTSTTPTGLTFGEPAFVQGLNSFYVTNSSGTSVRVGAEVDTDTSLGGAGSTHSKLATQLAVKTYVDNNLASGAVTNVNGVTGAVVLRGGGTYGVTFTVDVANKNIWVSNIGVTAAAAGSGISVSGTTGTVTISNTGVTGITGTTNQINVNVNTGYVTLSLPSAITTPGSLTTTSDLTVGGNLVVNGTTTTVNSTTVTVQDPVIVLGGTAGVNDSKDRGIQFNYDGGNTGFFGYDDSANRFVMYVSATNSSEVFSGTTGDAHFGNLYLGTGSNFSRLATVSQTGDRSFLLPNYSGFFLVPSSEGSSNNIIKSNGAGSQPTWIDPTASGFTAFAATNAQTSLVVSDAADTTSFIAFVNNSSDSYQALKYNSGLGYNASTNNLTATTFTGTLSGNASSATNATNAVNVISTEQTTGTYYLVGMAAAGTTGALLIDASGATALSYNVATATVTCGQIEALVDGGSY